MYCKNCGKKIEDDWTVCPYCNSSIEAEKENRKDMGAEVKPGDMQRFVPDPNMKLKKFNFAKYLILSLVTLGIYSIVVLYRFTKTVNILCDGDEKESPNYIVVYLLGIVTLGVYQLYWIYKQAERMQDIAPKYNCTISTSPVSIPVSYTHLTLPTIA